MFNTSSCPALRVSVHGLKIEWPAITDVEHARLIATLDRMRRRIPWQADVGGGVHLLPCAIGGDIGESAFQPHVDLVTRMAVTGHHILGRCPQQNLSA